MCNLVRRFLWHNVGDRFRVYLTRRFPRCGFGTGFPDTCTRFPRYGFGTGFPEIYM